MTQSGKAVGNELRKEYETLDSKDKAKSKVEESISEEVNIDDPILVDEEIECEVLLNDKGGEREKNVTTSLISNPPQKFPPSFSQILKNKYEDVKFKKFLSMFKTLSMNIPLIDVLLEMSEYAKLIKDLVTKIRSMNSKMVEVSHHCSEIMSSNMVVK